MPKMAKKPRKPSQRDKDRSSNTGRTPRKQSLLHDEPRVSLLLQCISAGAPITHACKAAGIAYRTYRDWYNLGEKGDPRYVDFYERAVKADGEFVTSCVALIHRAANKEWTAAAWLLERRYPKDFGRRQEITGPDGGPLQVTDTGRDKILKLLKEMHDRQQPKVIEATVVSSKVN